MYNCNVKVYQNRATMSTAPVQKNHEPLKNRRRVIYSSDDLQEKNKSFSAVFNKVNCFPNELEMK